MERIIYTAFAAHDDITFIMEEINDEGGEYMLTRCIGWYCGEPDEKRTNWYTDSLIDNPSWPTHQPTGSDAF